LACACGKKSRRGAQANARGATQVLGRDVQAIARGAARCLLHVFNRSAKDSACGRSFEVLSAQVSTAGLRLRHSSLACGSMLEESRDALATGKEQLVSCSAEQSKNGFVCAVTLGP
jgi:hypothetical protein